MHLDSFKAVRWTRTINLVLQALLFTSFFGGLNYLSIHYSLRWDLTRAHRHSLSPETVAYLRGLTREVKVYVTLSKETAEADPQGFADIKNLLREYAATADAKVSGNSITVEYIDVFQRPREAKELDLKQDAIFFICGDKRRGILQSELYKMDRAERKAFIGEQIFTAAVLDVSSTEQKKIYFLTGHGELRLDDPSPLRGLSTLGGELKIRNFAVETLDIGVARKVPDDASLVIIAAPDRVEPFVQEKLRQYLSDNAGRIIILLATRTEHGLDALLEDWGVWAHDVVICDNNPENITEELDLTIRSFAVDPPHPITQTVRELQLSLRLGETRCISPLPSKVKGSGLSIIPLATTSPTAWGERNYRGPRPYTYDQGIDIRGTASSIPRNCLSVAVASEPVQAGSNLPLSVKGGRLVVFGAADLIVNNRIIGTPGNQNIFLSAVNWAVERDTQLAIQPRAIEKFQIALSQDELSRLRYTLWFGLPAIAAGLGLIVYWTRRS